MRKATEEGLVSSHADAEIDRHWDVHVLYDQKAAKELEDQLTVQWRHSAWDEAKRELAKPDILVTNLSDKEYHLGHLEGLNQTVRAAMQQHRNEMASTSWFHVTRGSSLSSARSAESLGEPSVMRTGDASSGGVLRRLWLILRLTGTRAASSGAMLRRMWLMLRLARVRKVARVQPPASEPPSLQSVAWQASREACIAHAPAVTS